MTEHPASPDLSPAGHRIGRDLLAILLIAPAPIIGVWLAFQWKNPDGSSTAMGYAAFVIGKLWMLLGPWAWWCLVEKQRPSLSPSRHGGYGLGVLTGVVIFAAIVGAYLFIGERLIDHDAVRAIAQETGLANPWMYLGLVLFWIFVNSVLEEYVYRWFLQVKTAWLGAWGSAIASSALFTVHHVLALKYQFDWTVTIIASSGVFAGGMIWCWLVRRTKSIWPAWVSHALADVAVFLVGYWVIFG